jgi:hypothetical protein
MLAALFVATAVNRPPAAVAEYGQAARQAVPAMVPSPFRPEGEMGKWCEVVALGREDVCLEPKKLITLYDQAQLDKASLALADYGDSLTGDAASIKEETARCIALVQASKFDELEVAAKGILATAKDAGYKPIKADADALIGPAKRREASPAAQATIKLAKDVSVLVGSL